MENQKSKDKILRDEDSEGQNRLPEILDVVDLIELLRVSKQVVVRLINEKRIPAFRIAQGRYLISSRQLVEHIEKNTWNY
ncbi:MAG: helix-turn-helix domain-containing protein [Actinobacteria bacterium]|nr:helix-turn-helix domain-containing protein [Actinomycetota bacterium]